MQKINKLFSVSHKLQKSLLRKRECCELRFQLRLQVRVVLLGISAAYAIGQICKWLIARATIKFYFETFFSQFSVNLFDDHGAEDIKCVTMTQWQNDSKLLIVHGSSEIEDQHSFVSIVRVPSMGCRSCKLLRENDSSDQRNDLCMQCNLTVHTKYRFNDATQKFDPRIHLNCPDYIIMSENSLIHTINVKLDMQTMKKSGCGVISSKYLKRNTDCDTETGPSYTASSVTKPISIVAQILADFSEYECQPASPVIFKSAVYADCEASYKQSMAVSMQIDNSERKSPTGRVPINYPGASQMKPASPQSPELLEAAAKTYEFSEENEKCEKISIFRKRRLADKKYEFNEENTENIIPFNRTRTLRRPIYQHRTSPHPSFRSPCGSPVANRCIMSPPGFRSPSYYAYRSSPTHLLYSPPARPIGFR